jgi:hypothetical protein
MTSAKTDASVVLVHAAWTDGSSWNKVTGELQRKGLKVVAAQIPLTSAGYWVRFDAVFSRLVKGTRQNVRLVGNPSLTRLCKGSPLIRQ